MKTIILSSILLVAQAVSAQDKSSIQRSLKTVGELIGTATADQVKTQFNEPSDELISPESHLLLYKLKVDSTQVLFKFGDDRTLRSFTLDDRRKRPLTQLQYAKAKEARFGSSKDEILTKLGYPQQVIIENAQETWYYKFGNKQSGEKNIVVNYSLSQPQVVKDFKYYADLNNSAAFTSDMIRSIKKGIADVDDVEKELGEPTKVLMSATRENWYYISGQSTLIVYFDNQSKVKDYLFARKATE